MRFSLTTLFIAALWFASLGLIVFYYHPWQRVRLERYDWPNKTPNIEKFDGRAKAPDGRRSITYDGSTYLIVDGKMSYHFDYWQKQPQMAHRFLDDDTLEMFLTKGEDDSLEHFLSIYKRRFPEWWWGHFYRLEVWLFIGLTVALIARLMKYRRGRSAAQPIAGK